MTTRNENIPSGRYLVQDQNHMSDSSPTIEEIFHGLGRLAGRPSTKPQQHRSMKTVRATKASSKHAVSMN